MRIGKPQQPFEHPHSVQEKFLILKGIKRHYVFLQADISTMTRRLKRKGGARKGSLDFRHPHLGFNRVSNETILMGGVMHLIELFRTGLSVVAPRNLRA